MSAPGAGGAAGGATRRCPECGVENRADIRRCVFCGRKLARDEALPPAGGAWRTAAGTVVALVVAALIVAGLTVAGKRVRELRVASPAPSAPGMADKRRAAAACEEHTRGQVRSPFRVIAFRSSLVAEEEGGFVVSGTVDLQSLAGELERRRYWCRVRRDARAGAVVEEGRVF